MKKEAWKQLLQILITILTALLTTLGTHATNFITN